MSDFKSFIEKLNKDASFEEFEYEVSQNEIELSRQRSPKMLMIDIWADANAVASCASKDVIDEDTLQQALQRFHNHCGVLYKSFPSEEYRGLIWECKVSEWVLDNVVAGDNEVKGTPETAMSWFNHLYKDINYSLLIP